MTDIEHLRELLGDRVTAEDSYLLEMFAASWATWRQARADVAAQGAVVMSGGTAIAHPALSVASAAQREILALARELTLSPAVRRKLGIRKPVKHEKPQTIDELMQDVKRSSDEALAQMAADLAEIDEDNL